MELPDMKIQLSVQKCETVPKNIKMLFECREILFFIFFKHTQDIAPGLNNCCMIVAGVIGQTKVERISRLKQVYQWGTLKGRSAM